MDTAQKQGLFIVLDGNDGSGKATQTELLVQALAERGIASRKIDFPGYTRSIFGRLLADCLAGKRGDFAGLDPRIASVLYAADRFTEIGTIRDALACGEVIIADRFTSSNQIHQGGKLEDEGERLAFMSWLGEMEYEAFGIPRPDRIIYLKVPLETSLALLAEKRAAKNEHLADGEMDQVESDRQYLLRSHETAGWLANREPNWRLIECTETDGSMCSREKIHQEVLAAIADLL